MENTHGFVTILWALVYFADPINGFECSEGLLKTSNGTGSKEYIKFSVLMSLRRPEGGVECGPILESQLQVLAAIQWAVERINSGGLLPFAKLGYDLYDDCGMPWYTAQGLQELYGCHLFSPRDACRNSDGEPCSDIGILGLTRNMADRNIQEFTYRRDIPVVSPFTTGTDTPSNIRTTRPEIIDEAKLLLRILKELNWVYVVVVHTDDDYSTANVQRLKELARNESICIDIIGSLPVAFDKNESLKMRQLVDKVWKARLDAGTETLGTIYYGKGYIGSLFAKAVTDKIQASGETKPLRFILSESLTEWTAQMSTDSAIPESTLMLQPAETVMADFELKYNTFWANETWAISASDFLEEVMNEFNAETGRLPVLITKNTRNNLVSEAVDAVYTLAVAYRNAQNQKCGSPSTNCQDLKTMPRSEMITCISRVKEMYYSEIGFQVAPAEFVSAERRIGQSLGFDVVLFDSSFDGFKQKVASLMGDEFASTLKEQDLPLSACHGPCPRCASPSPYQYAYIDGDILLMGVLPVHSSKIGSPFDCGEFKGNTIHRILPEAFAYGIQKIRERTGINFGAVAFDSCESPSRTLLTLSDFMSGDVKLTSPGTSEIIDPDKVRVIVGAYNSGVTVPLTMFFTNLGIPVVSYSASSPDLDDHLNFPYFLRSVPSDVEQAKAMVSVIKEMKWEYVSLLYVDNNYGTKGKQAFIDIATQEGICVTQPPLALSQVRKENEDNDVLTLLRNQIPEVVVLFVIEERVAQFLHNQQEQFERIGQSDNIIYLASEDWGQSQHVLNEGKTRTLGSITLRLGSTNAADKASFASYIKNRTLSTQTNYNPFFNELWANEFSCSPDSTFDDKFSKPCSDNLRIPDALATEWERNQRIVHLLNSMYAVGDGIKQERDKLCNGGGEFICQAFIDHPEIVTAAIQNARFFDSGREFAIFGEDRNGVTGFDVLNVQKNNEGNPHYVKIGSFSNGELILDRSKLTFYNGDVAAKCGPDHCQDCKRKTGTSSDTSATCTNMAVEDLHMRAVDMVIITILAIVCVILIAKMSYNTIRVKCLQNRDSPKLSKCVSEISMAELQGGSVNYSGGSSNYSAGSLNYSGGSLQCSGGSMPSRAKYDKPPPPRRFVRPGDDPNERYSSTPTSQTTMRKESVDYLRPDDMRKADSHIYNTTNLDRD